MMMTMMINGVLPTLYLLFGYVCLQADSGGLVSPGGISYIGRSHEQLGEIPAAIAIKRCTKKDTDNHPLGFHLRLLFMAITL